MVQTTFFAYQNFVEEVKNLLARKKKLFLEWNSPLQLQHSSTSTQPICNVNGSTGLTCSKYMHLPPNSQRRTTLSNERLYCTALALQSKEHSAPCPANTKSLMKPSTPTSPKKKRGFSTPQVPLKRIEDR
ncbi:hypothetical protein OS493_019961 [Desmophyllum pertusum]|uniref:Uncharacterized protein n=1 Tax=Desmophyllum pertusum TaxID=174260 RepID=A0A9X0CLL7_9CNID|nr:hypothetical protein OS493_019961 [Desmophyllum pertusum]